VVDIQERLSGAMDPQVLANVVRNVEVLGLCASRFEWPTLLTEQYPKGLGNTLETVADAMESGARLERLEKTSFSVCGDPMFEEVRQRMDCDEWVVCGMEAHVCVYQTVRDLVERGARVRVVSDGVCSRTKGNWATGLDHCRALGATVTSTETIAFSLLGDAKHPHFKEISRALR